MLVLTRREGESIQVGDDIRITVIRVSPRAVRIGIEAPRDCNIVRQEILLKTEDEDVPEKEPAPHPR